MKHDESKAGENAGWIQLIFILFLFPILFFLCVYFPIWIGVASPY